MFSTLINPEDLVKNLQNPDWVVFDCRFSLAEPDAGQLSYIQGHIPNARYVNLDHDLSSPKTATTGRHPLPNVDVFASKLSMWGVNKNTQVVIYDSAEGAFAARMWWMLRWLGHDAVALLNGGFERWQNEGHPVTAKLPDLTPRQFIAQPNADMLIDADAVETARQAGKIIIDARGPDRFAGQNETLDPIGGHVPSAINMPFMGNLAENKTFLSENELKDRFTQVFGQTPSEEVINMCGSGVTACHNLLAMEMIGMTDSKLYVGSWSDWITTPSRPVATGSE